MAREIEKNIADHVTWPHRTILKVEECDITG